ncbi:SDR family oxidoreductase, partial [uncultured Anaerotruncus sp.]|uniref:SDR family oxidoreductase n=1 Tax=uncultured Anaerotruncus sp. TaxID=905011 RepID=UPI002590626F
DIDVLLNNAGSSIGQNPAQAGNMDDWDEMIATNINGLLYCTRCVLPGMLRRHSGRIVNISSIWGISGASCEVHYSASKAAVIGFTRALAQEVGPSGVTVNCVAPGVIDTEMNANLSPETLAALCGETPLCRIGSPEEVADAVVFLCGGKARFITGQVLKVDGGFLGG